MKARQRQVAMRLTYTRRCACGRHFITNTDERRSICQDCEEQLDAARYARTEGHRERKRRK